MVEMKKIMKFSFPVLMVLLFSLVVTAHEVEYLDNESVSNSVSSYSSVYKLTAVDEALVINETTFWFEFRDAEDRTLRHADDSNYLETFDVEYESVEVKDYSGLYCAEVSYNSVYNSTTDKFDELAYCSKEDVEMNSVKVVEWKPLAVHTVDVGESIKIRVRGRTKRVFGTHTDNVLVLQDFSNPKADYSGYVKFEDYAWWNNSYLNRKNLTIIESSQRDWINATFPYLINTIQECYNLTGVVWATGNASRELRVIDPDAADYELSFDVISNTSTSACIVFYPVNVTANTSKTVSFYYNNVNASIPSYTDRVNVNTAGDDRVVGLDAYGYNASIDMNGGALNSFFVDGTEIEDETQKRFHWMQNSAAADIFIETDVDDLCTQRRDGVVHSTYVCEAGEDSDKNGTCDSGETCMTYYFTPSGINTVGRGEQALDWEWNFVLDETPGNEWYFDNTTGTSYKVFVEGWLVNNLTTTTELYWLFDDNNNLSEAFIDNSGSSSRFLDGAISSDNYRLNAAKSYLMRMQMANATTTLNVTGRQWENRFDRPLEYNTSLGSQESVSGVMTINNETWITPMFETGLANFTLNVSWDTSFNYVLANFTWNGVIYTNHTNVTAGSNTVFTMNLPMPIVITNATDLLFNWTLVGIGNSSNGSTNTSSKNQTVIFAYYVQNISYVNPMVSGADDTFIINLSKHVSDASPLLYNLTIEYDGMNATQADLLVNTSTSETWNVTFTAPSVLFNTTFNFKSWLNISDGENFTSRTTDNLTQNVTGDGFLLSETYESPVFETVLANFSINISTGAISITDVNFTYNDTVYNQGVITNVTGLTTLFNISIRVPLVSINQTNMTFFWNWTLNNGTIVNTTPKNQTIYQAFIPAEFNWSTNITESATGEYQFNITNFGGLLEGVGFLAILQWNNTNYTTAINTSQTSTRVRYDLNITSDLLGNGISLTNATINITPYFNITFNGTTLSRNTSPATQTVWRMIVSNCTTPVSSNNAINFTILDEETGLPVSADLFSNWSIWLDSPTINRTYSVSWLLNNSPDLCSLPDYETFGTTSKIYYSAPGYDQREYNLVNATINSTTQLITLYLLNSTNSDLVTINVIDENDDPVIGAFVYVLAFDVNTTSYITVEILETDFFGRAYSSLILNDQWYKFNVVYNSELVLATTPTRVLTTSLNLQVVLGSIFIDDFIVASNVVCDMSFNNATNYFSLDFTNPTAEDIIGILSVNKITPYSDSVFNESNITSASATLLVGIDAENATYVGIGSIIIDDVEYVCGDPVSITFGGLWSQIGIDGIFYSFLLLLVFIGISLWSPVVGVVLTTLSLIVSVILGVFYLTWTTLVTLIIIGGIVIFKMKK